MLKNRELIVIKNIFYFLLLIIVLEVIFFIFFDIRPSELILFLGGLCVIYLVVQSIRKIVNNVSERK